MLRAKVTVFGWMLLLGVVYLTCDSAAQKARSPASWEKFDFARQVVSEATLQKLPLAELKRLRGIVFGRHGRVFKEEDIQDYLESRPWYRPDPKFQNARLNATERQNLDLIRQAEARKHKWVGPGDLRFYEDRAFTQAQLGRPTLAELHIMHAEIEAIHGKRFEAEPQLQAYFEERYWYQPDPNYRPDRLNETERKNLATLADAEKERRHLKLAPGDMSAYQNERITDDMLNGLSLQELRLLRNEIYALHGQRFPKEWMRQYFESQPWYHPLPEPEKPTLTPIEIRNVAAILKRENQIHLALSTERISPKLLDGLYLEDARNLRNEIYARHGKVFKTKWLQDYFSSFAWYKPDPTYQDSALSDLERRNVATIRTYEKQAQSMFAMVEG